MAYRLPPLNALRAFEAAARHLSFSKAAEELHVTPAAISHQIKALENYLGVPLFRRLNRSLRLSDEAQACLPKLREGFDCLSQAVLSLHRQRDSKTLNLSVAPSFAAKWLVPRLHRFVTHHPGIELRITAGMTLIDQQQGGPGVAMAPLDFHKDDIDIAIRFGSGKYPGLTVEKLQSVSVVPLCSPRLLSGEHPLRTPQDLRHHTLLHDDTTYFDEGRPDWGTWLRTAGATDPDPSRGPRFSHTALALDAAAEGQGVVLSLKNLALADIQAGRLVIPFPQAIPLVYAYYLVYPPAHAGRPALQGFREWILEEAREDASCVHQ